MQKYAFLYINSERSEGEIKEIIPYTITSKKVKYQEINLPQGTKELHSENCKMLRKKIKDDTNRWKDILHFWIGRINIVKMTILSKAIYRFKAIATELPMTLFTELEEKNVKTCMETQKTSNSQSNLEREKWNWKNQAP